MKSTLSFAELEQTYDLMAQAIDAVGEQHESLFLAKLCLTLAHHVDDLSVVESAIGTAIKGLES